MSDESAEVIKLHKTTIDLVFEKLKEQMPETEFLVLCGQKKDGTIYNCVAYNDGTTIKPFTMIGALENIKLDLLHNEIEQS